MNQSGEALREGAEVTASEVAVPVRAPGARRDAEGGREGPAGAIRPVPRVSIQVFCESSETGEVFQKAGEDRRLAKAHMTVQMGGIVGAIEHFQETATPNLVIVESSSSREVLLANLTRLAQVCDATTKVIVIGQVNDITTYRELIRQGINEYLVTPLSPLQILEAISSIYVDPSAPPLGRIMVFVGAKGGVGSSSLAHNTAWMLAEKFSEDVVLVDLDLPFGTASLDFNQDPGQGVADALSSPDRVDEVLLDRLLVKCSSHLSLFSAPGSLDREFDLDPSAFEIVLEIVRKAAPCVVVDMPHIWTAWSRSVLLAADEIVLTATPDLASLRNAKNLFERIKVARPNDNPPKLVLNFVGMPKRPEIPVKEFAETVGFEPQAIIPFEPGLFGTASNNGQMLGELDSSSASVELIRGLAGALIGRSPPPSRKSSFLDLLKGKKRSA